MFVPHHIREAQPSDSVAVIELFGIADDLHTTGAPYQFRGTSALPRTEQFVLELLRDPKAAILVAELAARVAGLVVVRIQEVPDQVLMLPRKFAQVNDLVVRVDMRGRGIGEALVRAAERWAQQRGVDSVELVVWEFNAAARRMYEKLGYATQYRRLRRVVN